MLHTGTQVDVRNAALRGLRLEDVVAEALPPDWPIGVQGSELGVRMHLKVVAFEREGSNAANKAKVASWTNRCKTPKFASTIEEPPTTPA